MTTEYIISEELATKVCAILINYGENRVANKLCSRPAPSAPTDEQCRICSGAIRKDEREKVLEQFAIRVRREFAQDDDEEWYLSSYDFEDCLEELKNDE